MEILKSNLSSALGWTLIHSIWQGVAIVLIFSILYYFSKPSNTRYWLGLGALGLQFLAAIVTFFVVYEPASTQIFSSENVAFTNFLAQTSNIAFTPQKLSILQQIEFFLRSNLDLFVTFWMLGTSLLLLRLVVGFSYVQGLKVQQVSPISADIQALMNNLLEKIQMPATIKLLESARATVPMTIGWLKPVVLLPVGIASGLTIKQLEAILAHELAHIKRYDYLVNIFQNFVEILFFFHPTTWFISAKVRDERENCCDDFAVEICGDRMVLAKALTQVASYQQQPRLAMAFGAKRQTFMDRIKRIIGINESKPLSYGNWTAVLGMILVVALGVVYAQKEVVKNGDLFEKKRGSEVIKINEIPVEITLEKLNNENNALSDSTSLDEVEAEMELLGKEMEKYGKEMEVYGKQMEEKYGRQMEKHGAEMEQIQRKMMLPQKKIQELSIEMQEASLAMQKLEMKYDDGKMPAEAKQKMADLQKKERELEKLMKIQEAEMNKIEAEMRPFEQKMNSLQSPMDSLSRLMERHSKPMDSLGRIMEEKGKVLEKLAHEEEVRFKKQVADFADMLFNAGLIKDKKDFEVRLKGEKLLIDLEPQSPAVYDKVWKWMNQTWGSRHKSMSEKDLRISVKGDNVNFSTYGKDYNYNRTGSFSAPMPPSPPSRVSPTPRVAPVAPIRESYLPTPTPRVAPQPTRVSTPLPPKPPKVVKVSAIKKDLNITKEMILDNKGTCSIYIATPKNGGTIVKAFPAILTNDKWTVKGLKVGDLVVVGSKEKLKNGDVVEIFQQEKAPKVGQVWQTPEQRGQAVMANEDPELERNEEGKNTSIYANPLLLNGQPLDYASFSIKSKGVLTVMKGKPTSPEAVIIPFRLYLRRNGAIVYEKKSSSKLTQVEVSEVLALSQVGDQIIINPTEKVDFKAKRIINVLL